MVKKKFIERSKTLGIRVPINHYDKLKEIIENIVDNYCCKYNLFTLKKEDD